MNIYEIAKKANVSTTTVSRVINSKEGVGPETRRRILKIIEEMNFQPKIATNSLDNIAFFYKAYSRSSISPYLVQLLNGVNSIIQDYGYNLILIPIDKIPKGRDEFGGYCSKRKISAGIFANLSFSDEYIENFEGVIPIVTIGNTYKSKKIVSIRSDNDGGAYTAVDYLIKSGHKKILFVAADLSIPDHYDRLLGYKRALKDNNIEVNEDYIIKYQVYQNIEMTFERLMDGGNTSRPTAAFICDDNEVIKCMSLLKKINISIPDEFSLIGFDDYDFSVHLSPPLTTVRQSIFEMGEYAARVIVNIMNNNSYIPDNVMLDTNLIIRKSVKSQ